MGLLFINWSKYSLVFALFYASIISFLLYSLIIVNLLFHLMGGFKQNDLAVMLFFIQGSKKIELLARNRRNIWSLYDCNRTQTYSHLVHKRALIHLAKMASLAQLLSVCLWTKWLWVRVPLQSFRVCLLHICFKNYLSWRVRNITFSNRK